jgi:hypothetical protein
MKSYYEQSSLGFQVIITIEKYKFRPKYMQNKLMNDRIR